VEEEGNFDWVPFFKELSEKLGDFENNQAKLVEILNEGRQQCGLSTIQDRDDARELITLEVIDPFTFMALIMTTGADRRQQQLQYIAEKMKLTEKVPSVFDGVPSANAQRAWMFRFQSDRSPDDIPKLWDIYKSAKTKTLTSEQWDETLALWGVGLAKLTEALFWCFPEDFLPLDAQTRPFLLAKGVIQNENDNETLASYTKILETTSNELKMPFHEVSHKAYLWNQQDSGRQKKNMCQASQDRQEKDNMNNNGRPPLNQILYGPPGTGKTYNTVRKAVEICEELSFCKSHQGKHDENCQECYKAARERYAELKKEGRIEFITFHQSYGYEEFVEGIRASTESGEVSYSVEPGILKKICAVASSKVVGVSNQKIDFTDKRRVWKMSLGNTQEDEDYIYQECLEEGYILLG